VTQVKICGITNQEDALFAARCGAAALGFIFYPFSPRYIKPEDARKIISVLPDELVKVGVFVNEKVAEIKRVMEYCGLDMIQLHGDESPEFCREFPSARIIKAVELKNDNDLNHALVMMSRLCWWTAVMPDFTAVPAGKLTGSWPAVSKIKNR
jgi:phosphoribosylanthranilate isomerase